MNIWKKISFIVLVFSLLLLGMVAFLISTTSGLHLLFNAANYLVSGLKIGQVSGGWKNLYLKNIHYNYHGINFKVDECYLSMNLHFPGESTIHINDLFLKNVSIIIDQKKILKLEKTKQKKNDRLYNLSISYPIILDHIVFDNINIKINNTTVTAIHFSSGFSWVGKNISLKPTFLQNLSIFFPKQKNSLQRKIVEKKMFESRIRIQKLERNFLSSILERIFSHPFSPEVINMYLPLDFNLNKFKGKQISTTIGSNFIVNNMLLKASIIEDNICFNIINIDSNYGKVNAFGNIQLYGNYPISIIMESIFHINASQRERVRLEIFGALRKEIKIGMKFSGPVNMALSMQTRLTDIELPLNISIVSKQFYFPFIGDKKYQINNLDLEFRGKITNYALSFHTSIQGGKIPLTTIALDAKGNKQQISFKKLTVIALDRKAEVTAIFDLGKKINWYGKLKFNGFSAAKNSLNYSSKLNGISEIRGSFYKNNWYIDIPKLEITGNMNQNKVKIEGILNVNNYLRWIIPKLYISVGDNIINIRGNVKEKNLDFDLFINAPNLSKILPKLKGTVKGLVKVRGTVKSPHMMTDITANNLSWKETSLSIMQINSNIQYIDQIYGKLNIWIKNFSQPGIHISIATLIANGEEKNHDFHIKVQGEPISTVLHLVGKFDHKKRFWRGKLYNTYFTSPVRERTGEKTATLDYCSHKQKTDFESNCVCNSHIRTFLLSKSSSNAIGKRKCILKNFSRYLHLPKLKQYSSDTIQVSGIFNSNIEITWNTIKKSLLQGSIVLSGHNVRLIQILNNTTLLTIFDTLILKAYLYDNSAELNWLVHLSDNSQFDGKIQIINLMKYRTLIGNVNIRKFNLIVANIFSSYKEKILGTINANLRISGSITSPKIFGKVQLYDIDIEGSTIPFDIRPNQITVNFNGMHSKIFGEMNTRQGLISLNGNMYWSHTRNWRVYISAKSEQINITIPPMTYLSISPSVFFEFTPKLLTFYGRMDIPWARIVVHELLENTIEVSSDEIMIDENLQPIIKSKNINVPVNSSLFIHIGDNVRIDAFGMQAKITGDLKVIQNKQGISMNGEINFPEGRIRAYGQDLLVQKGELLFSGPLNQPFLNIEAIRNPKTIEGNTIAGVRITGMADELKTEFFSNPVKSQQEILSYLLRGHGLDSHKNDSTEITSILLGLGVTKSDRMMKKIGKKFGISNLALDTQGVGDSSQVAVSGYVLPDLQIRYSLGIFNSVATFMLRYRLLPNLYLETLSGTNQALDLLYQLDFE